MDEPFWPVRPPLRTTAFSCSKPSPTLGDEMDEERASRFRYIAASNSVLASARRARLWHDRNCGGSLFVVRRSPEVFAAACDWVYRDGNVDRRTTKRARPNRAKSRRHALTRVANARAARITSAPTPTRIRMLTRWLPSSHIATFVLCLALAVTKHTPDEAIIAFGTVAIGLGLITARRIVHARRVF